MPIIREKTGLALSSRNSYLSEKERESAIILSQILIGMKEKHLLEPQLLCEDIRAWGIEQLSLQNDITIDYLEIYNKKTLAKCQKIDNNSIMIAAVFVGTVRLIDNVEIKEF
jgi:pantoate--beta-alanine ligase